MNSQIFISLALCLLLFQFTSCGKIIETVKEDVHKAGEKIDCAFREIGTFLGIGKRGPCDQGNDQKASTDGKVIQDGFGQGGAERNSFGQSGFEQVGFGKGGAERNIFGQSGFEQNGFGQGGFGQASGVGGNGQGQGMYTSGAFGQTGFGQGYSSHGQNSLGNREIGEFGNTQISGYGQKPSESTSGLGSIDKDASTGKSGLDMRFDSGSSSTSASPEASTKKLEISGRRIISAHSNCPAGYVADSRGRCRETF